MTSPLVELIALFDRLRAECPWKRAQTHETLARYLLEESYEAVEAMDAADPDALRDELGDVLLQVYLHAAIASAAGQFDVEDVAAGLRDKMIRRNPHIFAADGPTETDPGRIDELWQAAKAAEKPREGLMAGVPAQMPALLRAAKLIERAERDGTELDIRAQVDTGDDLGEQLLALVARAHASGVDPEQALRAAVRRRDC